MQSRSAYCLSSVIFPALGGGRKVVPGSVIGCALSAHLLPKFPHFCVAHPCPTQHRFSGSLLGGKEEERECDRFEALLHVEHFVFIE